MGALLSRSVKDRAEAGGSYPLSLAGSVSCLGSLSLLFFSTASRILVSEKAGMHITRKTHRIVPSHHYSTCSLCATPDHRLLVEPAQDSVAHPLPGVLPESP